MKYASPMSVQAYGLGDTTANERSAFRKITLRFLLPVALLTFVNAIDRMNVSFAGAAMSRDLGMSPTQFGTGVSLFFVAYLLFQYPHALLLRSWGARRWFLVSVMGWGACSFAMAFVTSPWQFHAVRFLLGTAEAGFAPGMTYLIGRWTPAHARGRALAIALAAVPVALVMGGPLCGALLSMSNPMDMPGWRWMFFAAAWPNVLLAVVAYFYFDDSPAEARWLTPAEKRLLDDAPVSATQPAARSPLRLRDSRLWRCAGVWGGVMTGSYALVYWLPQLVRQLAADRGEFAIAVLSAVPQAGIAAGLLLNAWHSDRTGERFRHVSLGALLGGIALVVAAVLPSGVATLALLTVAGLGIGAAQGVFWTLPGALQPGGDRPPVEAIAFISMFGTAGGIVGPYVMGALVDATGRFAAGIAVFAALLLLGAALVHSLHRSRR